VPETATEKEAALMTPAVLVPSSENVNLAMICGFKMIFQ
jgi:hypothetical protein